jgi:hypothetical protein
MDMDDVVPVVSFDTALSAYSVFVNEPGSAPHDVHRTIEAYTEWLATVPYRSPTWVEEHSKHMTASGAGYALWGGKPPPKNRFGVYILERGYWLEDVHVALLQTFKPELIVERCDRSLLHRTEPWIMATPDAFLHARTDADNMGPVVALAEFKTHMGAAHREVTREHMCQCQIAMEVTGVGEIFLSSLGLNDKTMESEWIVTRIVRSSTYWERVLAALKICCIRKLRGLDGPPTPCPFVQPDDVVSEVVMKLSFPIQAIERGEELVREGRQKAWSAADDIVARDAAAAAVRDAEEQRRRAQQEAAEDELF